MCEESVRYHAPAPGMEVMLANTSRSFPRHTHDQYGIGVIDAGGHASCSGRGPVEAGPGTFISVNPGEVHDGHAVGRRSRSWRILYFDPALMRELLTDVSGSDRPFEFTRPAFQDESLRSAFEESFRRAFDRDRDAAGMAIETAWLGLIAGLRAHSLASAPAESCAAPDIRRARERLDADPAASVSLGDLARECGLSRFQVLRALRRAFGLPPHAYLLQRRLALARRLLRSPVSLAEVAVAAGFPDQSHLTRCFTRQFGVPPARYAGRR